MKDYWEKLIDEDNKKIAKLERILKRIDRGEDKVDRKKENKLLKKWEKEADREMFNYDKQTERDFW